MSGKRRFSQLRPPNVDSNLFQYHLKQLIKEGFIEKDGNHYVLSQEGQRFANFYSFETDAIRLQPKILVAVVCYDGYRVLVHKRKREPYINQISLVNGKLHFGETLPAAAERELAEKTGFKAQSLRHAGDTYLRYRSNNEVVNHVLSHNFSCTQWRGQLRSTIHSEPFWITSSELKKDPDVLPGTAEIVECMESDQFFSNTLTFPH